MREYYINVSSYLGISLYDADKSYNLAKDKIYLGEEGEDEATRLHITLDDDFTGNTYYLLWDGETTSDPQSDITLTYDVPSDYTTKGRHHLQIEIHGTTQIYKTPKLHFEVM